MGRLVAEAVRVVRQSALPDETNAMFTNLEGEWDEVMGVIRVSVFIKLDYRPQAPAGRLDRDVESIERQLG